MRKPLYVSDLDGTLMRSDRAVSPHSAGIINSLIGRGMCFTVATARTIRSASGIIRDIRFTLPVITLNGTVLADARTGKATEAALFSPEDVAELRRMLRGRLSDMVVKSFFGEDLHRTYLRSRTSTLRSFYLDEHKSDPLLVCAGDEDSLFAGEVRYISLIGRKEDLAGLAGEIARSGRWGTLFQKDTYCPEYWLEIFPKGSSKAEAIRKLQRQAGCDGIVVFGDSVNDLSAFRVADESYAVSNASAEVKAEASGVIGSNDGDAVAEWLLRNAVLPR